MEIHNLINLAPGELTAAFNAAFQGYFVPVNFSESGLQTRLLRARVDLELSFGVFAPTGELAAFVLSGIDQWQGLRTVYNAGTGVLPAYRGQHLVDQMYAYAMPHWQAAGCVQASLEVIDANVRAIKVYERIGLVKGRELWSYQGELRAGELPAGIEIKEVISADWPAYAALAAFEFSWDFIRPGVEALGDTYRFFELRQRDGVLLAYAIVSRDGQIAQAGVTFAGHWENLWTGLGQWYPHLKWINIAASATELVDAVIQQGWKKIIGQYEMWRIL
jgi:hypothetical protein